MGTEEIEVLDMIERLVRAVAMDRTDIYWVDITQLLTTLPGSATLGLPSFFA